MTAPTEPSVEASEALVIFSDEFLDAWNETEAARCCTCDGCNHYSPTFDPAKPCEALEAVAVEVQRQLADHERAVRQARAEGWDEAVKALAWCLVERRTHPDQGLPYVAEHNPYRAAQPEDARGGEAGE